MAEKEKAKQAGQAVGTQVDNENFGHTMSGDGRAFVVHKAGRMKVISLDDGDVFSETTVPVPVWDGLAIATGKLFLLTHSGELICLGDH